MFVIVFVRQQYRVCVTEIVPMLCKPLSIFDNVYSSDMMKCKQFIVRSKTDWSAAGNKTENWRKQNQKRKSISSNPAFRGIYILCWGGFVERVRFISGMKEWMSDDGESSEDENGELIRIFHFISFILFQTQRSIEKRNKQIDREAGRHTNRERS